MDRREELEDCLVGLEEHLNFHYSTESESDRGEAVALGYEHPLLAWILTDRDVWHKNPYYSGPPVRHPEDDSDDEELPPLERFKAEVDDELPF